MPKQLNINLAMTADTSQAKAQLQDLQKQLSNLMSSVGSNSHLGITKQLQEASIQVATLKTQLQAATNVNTGKLDLSKFSQSLQDSKTSIESYRNSLLKMGPEGAQAFSQLSQAIMQAEVPLRRSNALLTEFATTMKNTVRWQLSSSMLHGFMGAMQSAYGYAQDLNESLTNIRIVTGQTSDQMAQFAERANKAAQALSTSTTSYTDAALIFYQQGLNDKEVAARTEATIKMAQATGDSSTEVSSYMTAIWNNFAEGSDNLEHFSDVITALGASTASSSSEIASGLQQFAAIGETVGLSYDYATSALATLVANTRQSADSIGNSLKTIFSRLQGLSVGETLEDGVNLNKYSKALAAIGVDIIDANGNLMQMDDILEATAEKWDTLNQKEKMGFAQTVAGVRQYTQLIALMDNWDDMQRNLETARNSDGTLQEQADIYAESWEAASKRVKAAAQSIYQDLINDKFFIQLNNFLTIVLKGIDSVIDGIGGLKGVLIAASAIILKSFGGSIATSLNNITNDFRMMSVEGRKAAEDLRKDTNKALTGMYEQDNTLTGGIFGQIYKEQANAQDLYLDKAKNMTEEQQKIARLLLDQHNTLVKNAASQGQVAEQSQKQFLVAERMARAQASRAANAAGEDPKLAANNVTNYAKQAKQLESLRQLAEGKIFGGVGDSLSKDQIDSIVVSVNTLGKAFSDDSKMIEAFGKTGKIAIQNLIEQINTANGDATKIKAAFENFNGVISESEKKLAKLAQKLNLTDEQFDVISKACTEAGVDFGVLVEKMINVKNVGGNLPESFEKIKTSVNSTMTNLVSFGQKLSALAMGITALKGIFDTWKNEDMTVGEKLLQTMMSLSMVIPIITTTLGANTIATVANTVAEKANAIASGQEAIAKGTGVKAIAANTVAKIANLAATHPLITATLGLAAAIGIATAAMIGFSKADFNGEKARKNAEKLTEEYKNVESELNGLNSELETTQQKINELNNSGPLSFTDEEELSKLERQEASLQAQIEAQKQLLELKQQEAAIEYNQAISKGQYKIEGSGANSGMKNPGIEDSTDQFQRSISQDIITQTLFQLGYDKINNSVELSELEVIFSNIFKAANSENGSVTIGGQEYSSKSAQNFLKYQGFENLEDAILSIRKDFTKYASDITQQFSDNLQVLDTLYAANKDGIYDSAINKIESENAKYYEAKGTLGQTSVQAFKNAGFSESRLNEIKDSQSIDSLTKEELNKLQEQAKNFGISVDDIISAIFNWDGAIKYATDGLKNSTVVAEDWGSKYQRQNGVISKISDGGTISAEDYNNLDEKYQEAFYKTIDGYKLLGKTAKEVQKEFRANTYKEAGSQMQELNNSKHGKSIEERTNITSQVNDIGNQLITSAINTDELEYATNLIKQTSKDSSLTAEQVELLSMSLEQMASQYANTSEEATALENAQNKLNTAIQTNNTEMIPLLENQVNEAQNNLLRAVAIGEAAAAYNLDAEAIEYYIDELKEMDAYQGLSEENLTKLGIAAARANQGFAELTGNSKKYSEIQSEIDKVGLDNVIKKDSKACNEYTKSLSDLLNCSEDVAKSLLKDKNNSEDLKKALNGNKDAVKALDKAARELASKEIGIDPSGFEIGEEGLNAFLKSIEDANEGEAITLVPKVDIDSIQDGIQQIMDSSSSLEDFQNRMSQLDLFGEMVDVAAEDLDGLGNVMQEVIARMNADGYVLVENAKATTNALAEASAYDEQVGTENGEIVNEAGDGQTPEDIEVRPGNAYTMTLPQFSKTGGDAAPGWSLTGKASFNLRGVRWVSGGEEPTEGGIEKTPVTRKWIKPVKGGGAGGLVNKNMGATRAGGGGGRRGGGGGRARGRSASTTRHTDTSHNTQSNLSTQLSAQTSAYERLSKAGENAFGKSKLKNMDEEIKKQSEIIKKTQELVKETKKLADAEKDRLKGKTNISGFSYIEKYKDSNGAISQREKNGSVNAKSILGLTDADFAADGSLLNEALIEKKLADRENAAQKEVDKYSDKDEDNASRIVAENALARVQAENDAIRAEMEQYKADAEAYWEHVEQEYEARMQKKALELSKIQYKLKLEIDISDDDINYLQHLLERAQKVIPINGMFGTTQNYQLGLLQQQQQEYGNKISSTKNAIIDILKQGGLTQAQAEKFLESGDLDIEKLGNVWATSFSEEQIEALREYKHNLLEFETEWENIDDIISHLVVDSMEQWLTEMDKVQAGLDAGLKTLEHYDNTISIVGKEFLGVFSSQTAALRWATVEQQQSIARGAKKTYEVAKEYQDKAIAIYEEAKAKADLGDLEAQASLSNLKKAADEATATVYERLSEWQGAVDAALQGARDAFEKIIEEYTKDVLKPFNDLQEARERNKQAQEGYLDTTTKYYELAKLTRDINKSIDESTNIKNKEALVRVLQKVNKVREDGAKLTQYESDYLRKEYELELARLQLAEAREAKSEVRIARDSEGNFSYVYTADQNKLDEATKNFEDKLQEAYELSRNYIESTQDLILSYQQEAAEKIQELYLMDLEDDEREKKEKEILEHYKGLIEEQSKNLELGLDNQKGLYENYYKELEKMGQSIALPQDFIDEWQEIDLTKTFDGIVKSAQDFADHFNKVIEDIAKKSKEEFLKYSEETAEILEDEGSLQKAIDEQGNLTITYNFDIDKVLSGAVEGENAITQFAEDSVKSLETLADSVTNWAEDAINNFNQVTDSIADITTALSNLNKELSLNDFWAENGDGMAVARVFANLYSEPNANGETEFYRINGKTAELNEQQVRLDLINRGIAQTTNQDMVLKAIEEALKKKGLNVSRFATGGYTGNWSGGGRLGILDQKELILNDKDTKNILDVVSMVRDISNKINLSAMMSQFEALTYARPGKVSSIGDEGVLEQYVNITLDAPNLVDKNSVLEAFDNVINLAAQYAYKRR